jgi:hypothetical protein
MTIVLYVFANNYEEQKRDLTTKHANFQKNPPRAHREAVRAHRPKKGKNEPRQRLPVRTKVRTSLALVKIKGIYSCGNISFVTRSCMCAWVRKQKPTTSNNQQK